MRTTRELAVIWGASEERITRWCRMDLLPAVRTVNTYVGDVYGATESPAAIIENSSAVR